MNSFSPYLIILICKPVSFRFFKVAFLSNEVNLVEQQTNKIIAHLPNIQKKLNENNSPEKEVIIEKLHGEMGIEYWNKTKWVNIF